MDDNRKDYSTQSNFEEASFVHCALNLTVDFTSKLLSGFAKYKIQIKSEGTEAILFDTKHLIIQKIESEGKKLTYSLGTDHEIFGQVLSVLLPEEKRQKGAELEISVHYATTDKCTSIQWLPPEQTADKKFPYLFTQGQAINNRSLFPCQDCPAAKFTYDAVILAPFWATVLMSALEKCPPINHVTKLGWTIFEWTQPVPVSSYLVAMAVGKLESRDISPRCRVWAEPSLVELAASDYSQTEQFLKIAEDLTCPYLWTRYDILCLPPSFPYGGMENPCLTFMTPTTLTGDRSLADVVAHEISHSWTGNLVTNYTWEHFWLNEGWTMWLQRKIMSRIHKNDLFFQFDAQIGRKDLRKSLEAYGESHEFTKLIPSLQDCDPDDAFSSVPYEKGFALLFYLQGLVGETDFEAFAKAYIEKFKYAVITSRDFKNFFLSYFEKSAASSKLKEIEWDKWFGAAGAPPVEPELDNSLSAPSEILASHWLSVAAEYHEYGNRPRLMSNPSSPDDIKNWQAYQLIAFLDVLNNGSGPKGVPHAVLESMDGCYSFTASTNAEVKYRWFMLCLKSDFVSIAASVLEMVKSVGRMKFTRPLYRELAKNPLTKEAAIKTFLENRHTYHPITRKMVAKDLGVSEEPSNVSTPEPTQQRNQNLSDKVIMNKKSSKNGS